MHAMIHARNYAVCSCIHYRQRQKIDFCRAFMYEVYIFAKEYSQAAPQRPPWGQRKVFVIEKRQLWGGKV